MNRINFDTMKKITILTSICFIFLLLVLNAYNYIPKSNIVENQQVETSSSSSLENIQDDSPIKPDFNANETQYFDDYIDYDN